jgi:UDP-N-acetylmuramate dehydrogenase
MDRLSARDPRVAAALRARVRGEVREMEALGRYSTYRIGGPATVLLPATPDDVSMALRFAADEGVPWFALGLGSNLLLPDEGLEALVIRVGKGLDQLAREGDRWRIGAGLPAPLAARRTAEAGYAGLHIFIGVPGSVGGGVYMNAGCHGGDWAAVVETVTVVHQTGDTEVLARERIPFDYRRSGLTGGLVIGTTVRLRPDDPARIGGELEEMYRWRREGTPFNQPCCGSVFQNPGGPSWKRDDGPRTAGQLIEAAGLKGFRIGGAEVSPMHANYFVNTGDATAADVRALIDYVRGAVEERFGTRLETEVKLIGAWGEYMNTSER